MYFIRYLAGLYGFASLAHGAPTTSSSANGTFTIPSSNTTGISKEDEVRVLKQAMNIVDTFEAPQMQRFLEMSKFMRDHPQERFPDVSLASQGPCYWPCWGACILTVFVIPACQTGCQSACWDNPGGWSTPDPFDK